MLWPGEHPKSFDLPLAEELEKRDLIFVFADGNHDNHAALRVIPAGLDGFVEVQPRLFWAPRGHRWNWSGIDFAAFGGAYSIDRDIRVEGRDVWTALEEPTIGEADRLGWDKVDVLLTHDVPEGVPLDFGMSLPGHIVRAANQTRILLKLVVDQVHPQIVFSGHHHQRVSHTIWAEPDLENHFEPHEVRAEVLHMDGHRFNAVVLDLPNLEVTDIGNTDPDWHLWTRKREKYAARRLNQP